MFGGSARSSPSGEIREPVSSSDPSGGGAHPVAPRTSGQSVPAMRVLLLAMVAGSAACGERQQPFTATVSYRPVARAGGQTESNDLFVAGAPTPRLVDSSVVAYADPTSPGRIVIADMIDGTGWSMSSGEGADGPGELNGSVPLVLSSGDTVKTLRPDGRVAARRLDGSLLYDKWVPPTRKEGMVAFRYGLAGDRIVSLYLLERDRERVEVGILFESDSRAPRFVPLDTVPRTPAGAVEHGFLVAARAGLVAYARGRSVATLDEEGMRIAERVLPWKVFDVSVDGSGRVWAQVLGGEGAGYNMVHLTRELELLGQAVVPRFRDAFGDFMVSERKDSLDVETFVLWKRRPNGE